MAFGRKRKSGEFGENRPKSAELAHQTAHLHRKGGPDTVSIEEARRQFLKVYACEAPGLLRGLCETVLPSYSESTRLNQPFQVQFTVAELAAGKQVSIPLELCPWSSVPVLYPTLGETLSAWASTFHLTFRGEPAEWAMETALETLRSWHEPKRPNEWFVWPWKHQGEDMHEVFPAPDPKFRSVRTGESEVEALSEVFSILITIPAWDRNSETEPEFKDRFYAECGRVYKEHVKGAKEWTGRRALNEPLYIDGLAMWQAGRSLSEIHYQLGSRGLDVGRTGDKDYDSAISKGLKRCADLVRLDQRPHSVNL